MAGRETAAAALTALPGEQDRRSALEKVPVQVGLQQGDTVSLRCVEVGVPVQTALPGVGVLLRNPASVRGSEQPHGVLLQVREREQRRGSVVREVPADRETAPATGRRGTFDGLHLHGGSSAGTGRVDDQIDSRIGGEPGAVDAEFEQLVLHEEFPGGADVLRRPPTTGVTLSHDPTTAPVRSPSIAPAGAARSAGQLQRARPQRRRAMLRR